MHPFDEKEIKMRGGKVTREPIETTNGVWLMNSIASQVIVFSIVGMLYTGLYIEGIMKGNRDRCVILLNCILYTYIHTYRELEREERKSRISQPNYVSTIRCVVRIRRYMVIA